MEKLMQCVNQFCVSTTGSLIGMYLMVQFIDSSTQLSVRDLGGLIISNLLITLLGQIIYREEVRLKIGRRGQDVIMYIGVLSILFVNGKYLGWLSFTESYVPVAFLVTVSVVYIGVIECNKMLYAHTAKRINEALAEYQNRRKV